VRDRRIDSHSREISYVDEIGCSFRIDMWLIFTVLCDGSYKLPCTQCENKKRNQFSANGGLFLVQQTEIALS
jgi:hypothetical protein